MSQQVSKLCRRGSLRYLQRNTFKCNAIDLVAQPGSDKSYHHSMDTHTVTPVALTCRARFTTRTTPPTREPFGIEEVVTEDMGWAVVVAKEGRRRNDDAVVACARGGME